VKPVVEVRVNPEDLAVLERASLRPSSITLIADPLVPRSGAIASSENKVVDDRFENRIRFAKEAVLAAAADLLREAPS
jgi:flagellar biosynthesis/type III secretory pathway protein FliH